MPQLPCQVCRSTECTSTILKCCQLFVCAPCRDKIDKSCQCPNCQKTLQSKKWQESDPVLLEVLNDFYCGKPQQCGRCDNTQRLQHCEDCKQNFCDQCIMDIHSVGLYQSHQITEVPDTKKVLQTKMNSTRQQICDDHRQKLEFVCECNNVPMCGTCARGHRQGCGRKQRSFSGFKNEYFTMMLLKLQQISKYKSFLGKTGDQYQTHFQKQRSIYQESATYVQATFSNFAKLIQYKRKEVVAQLGSYWEECLHVYKRNQANIRAALSQFDDLAMLIERFSNKTVGLDYLEKRMNVKSIQYDNFLFRINGLDSLEKQITQVTACGKKWMNPVQTVEIRQQSHQKPKGGLSLTHSTTTTPAMLTQIHENGLLPRPLKLLASADQIQYSFIQLPYQKLKYEVEFGVGVKIKGQEVFKRVQASESGRGVIGGLQPATVYRVRMRVEGGDWSDIYEISTLQHQAILVENCQFARADSKGTITLLRSGTLYASNCYQFGVHVWEIRILVDKTAHSQSQTACISIGISNREYKKAVFVGSTINYGFQRDNLKLKVVVDCDNNRMTITDQMRQQEETFQNIPDLPVFPTIINKGNSSVQIMITF